MADLVIRRAEVRDVHEMAELDRICFKMPWSERSFLNELTVNGNALYIVAETENKIVGFAGIWKVLDEGHITNVAVSPDYRRMHIGTAIVGMLLEVSEANGITSETLEVRASNAAAQGLYGKFGFEPAGLRKGYYEDNHEDAVIMWRKSE